MPSCLRTYEQSLSLYLVMDKGLIRRLVSGSPKRVNNASALVAKAGRRCGQMSASRLSSTNIAFFVGPRVPFEKTPGLRLSLIAGTRSCGHLFKSFGILTRLRRALCFWVRSSRSVVDCKCSASMHLDCASTSQLCGLTFEPNTDPVGMYNVWPTE